MHVVIQKQCFGPVVKKYGEFIPGCHRFNAFSVIVLGILFLTGGCVPLKHARVASVALTLEDVAAAASRQSDPLMVREGSAAHILLVDGLIEAYPRNPELLLAGCQAYSSYAASFIVDEDPRRASELFFKAREYGFRALSSREDFSAAAEGSLEDFEALLQKYRKRDVAALFWTANAWANWVALNLEKVEAIADLPALEALMKRVLALDEGFHYGSPHVLMGVYEASKPPAIGGSPQRAKAHFHSAFELGAHKLLTAKVLYAEYYARAVQDESLFVRTLEEVLAAHPGEVPELTLSNTLGQHRARKLLNKREEYFEELP